MKVVAFCYKNALFKTTSKIIINKCKYSCALDMHSYGQLYNNVTEHSEILILDSNMPLESVVYI